MLHFDLVRHSCQSMALLCIATDWRQHSGVRDVIDAGYEYISRGPLSQIFYGHAMPPEVEDKVILPAFVRSRFHSLADMIKADCADGDLEACLMALKHLEEIYRNLRYFISQDDTESGQTCRYMVMVSKDFVK